MEGFAGAMQIFMRLSITEKVKPFARIHYVKAGLKLRHKIEKIKLK
ncbi:hypothetical protein [Chryseobacterium indoltheticum]